MSFIIKSLWFLACFTWSVGAFRDYPVSLFQESLHIVREHGRLLSPIRQVLDNNHDTMYTANTTMGGQPVQGILDTGSFELVVFGLDCSTCGIARAYDETLSPTYSNGTQDKMLAYGSGSCDTHAGKDKIEIAGLSADNQSFWLASYCQMPLLQTAHFQAIVGIGPPGEPVYEAKRKVQDLQQAGASPAAVDEARREQKIAESNPDLIAQFQVRTFSSCFGREAGSPGYHIWNDVVPVSGAPGVLTAPVVGQITWSIEVKEASFHDSRAQSHTPIACLNGCGAIVDTGTTLLGFDTLSYMDMYNHIAAMNEDCSDLSVFPNLHMKIGDGELILPPKAYIGEVTTYASSSGHLGKLLHAEKPSPFRNATRLHEDGDVVMCQFMVMDMGMYVTSVGPEMIIGMSVFREYYVTFDLGSGVSAGPGDRTIFFAPANDECRPANADQQLGVSTATSASRKPLKIDASKIRVPKTFDGRL